MKLGEKLTEGPIFKKFVLFVIPVILTGFLQQLYNAVDTMVVGRFAGETALAAVGSTSAISALIITLFMGLSVGTNVVCAGFFGAGSNEGLERALHTSLLLAVIMGIPLTMVGWFGAEFFLGIMGTPSDIIEQATLYMRIYFLGVTANLVYNFGAAVLRAIGDTKKPLYILSVSGIVNVVLNVVCVVFFKMGVVGVALGTVVSQLISAVWVVAIFLRSGSDVRLRLQKLKLYKKEIQRVLAIGIPAGINGILFSLSNVFLQSAINSFGKATVAAHSVAWNFMAFSSLLLASFEQGTVSFVGQNIGAKRFDRVKSTIKIAIGVAGVACLLFTTVIVLNGRFFLSFFTTDAEIIEIGMVQMYTAISVYVFYVPDQIVGGALRGMGKSVLPTAINVVGICLLRVVWIWCVWPLCPTLEMVYYSFPVTWLAAGFAMVVAYAIERKKLNWGGKGK